MKIYKYEEALAEQLENNKSVAYGIYDGVPGIKKFVAANVKANNGDLYEVYSLLVSSVWNGNDDVFLSDYLYAARESAIDHPTNIGHNQLNIVGHITDVWAVNNDFEILEEDSELPEVIHIINRSVIYTYNNNRDKQEEIDNLISEIESGKKYVSMECLFGDFDYALMDETEGKMFTVERNDQSSFLTKHLRAYGGSGRYQNYRVGRVLKSFAFVGKGYVDVPANKDSVIFLSGLPFEQAAACLKDGIESINTENGVLSSNNTLENLEMSENLQKELDNAKAEINSLKEQVKTLEVANKTEELEKLAKANEELVAQNEASAKELTEVKAQVEGLEKALTEAKENSEATETSANERVAKAEEALKEAQEELSKAQVEKVHLARTSQLTSKGVDAEKAKSYVETYANLNDEQWNTIVGLVVKNSTTDSDGTSTASFNHDDSPEPDADAQKAEAAREAIAAMLNKGQ